MFFLVLSVFSSCCVGKAPKGGIERLFDEVIALVHSVLESGSFAGVRWVADAIADHITEAGYEVRGLHEVSLREWSLEVLKPAGSMGKGEVLHGPDTEEDGVLEVRVAVCETIHTRWTGRWTCTVAVACGGRQWATCGYSRKDYLACGR